MEDKELLQEVQEVIKELKNKANSLKEAADLLSGEEKDKANDLVEKVTLVLVNASNKIVESLKVVESKEEIKNGMEIVRAKSEELYEHALSKIDELKQANSAHFQEKTEGVIDSKDITSETTSDIIEQVNSSEIINDNSEVSKENIETVEEIVKNIEQKIETNSITAENINNLKYPDNNVVEARQEDVKENTSINTIEEKVDVQTDINVNSKFIQETVDVNNLISDEMAQKAMAILNDWIRIDGDK